ncbi:thioesterase family protein [Colletotrichum tofieldiae]|nr:thioesterase family protein [Colletotrichum tofieldiae]
MIPRSTARRVLRDLSSHRASRPLASFSPAALRPFTSTPSSRLQAQRPPMTPVPSPPPSSSAQQAAAANAALSNLSHLTPAQITALLSTSPPPGGVPGAPQPPGQQPPPSRRSIEDPQEIPLYRAQATFAAIDEYPILQSMIPTVNDAGTAPLPSDWENWEPYRDFPPEKLSSHLCGGTLNNPNALGLVHMVFRHRYTGELILAIMFGQGTSGWPSVVHGGMLSTVMDEAMGRLAALNFPANTAVTAKLSVDFKIPVTPGLLYIVRVGKALPEFQKQHPDEEDKTDRKMWVVGRMEDPEGATVLEAKGLFVVPKGATCSRWERGFSGEARETCGPGSRRDGAEQEEAEGLLHCKALRRQPPVGLSHLDRVWMGK